MLVAMVMSLGVMQGINIKNQTNNDTNLQQVGGLMGALNGENMSTGQSVAWTCTVSTISFIVGCGCPPLGAAIGL